MRFWVLILAAAAGFVAASVLPTAEAGPSDREFESLVSRVKSLEARAQALQAGAQSTAGKVTDLSSETIRLRGDVSLLQMAVEKPAAKAPDAATDTITAKRFVVAVGDGEEAISIDRHGIRVGKRGKIDASGIRGFGGLTISGQNDEQSVSLHPMAVTFKGRGSIRLENGGTISIGADPTYTADGRDRGGQTATQLTSGGLLLRGPRGEALFEVTTGDGKHPWLRLRSEDREREIELQCAESGAKMLYVGRGED